MKIDDLNDFVAKLQYIRNSKAIGKKVKLDDYLKHFSIKEKDIVDELDLMHKWYNKFDSIFKEDWTDLAPVQLWWTDNKSLRKKVGLLRKEKREASK
jgi:hypothetical protein